MIQQEIWSYFKAIEADLSLCQRYVNFSEGNYQAYSSEFAKIILLAGAEIDNVLRDMSSKDSSSANIKTYERHVAAQYPFFKETTVSVKGSEIHLQPWLGWSQDLTPDWWKFGYNKIKHERSANFKNATLQNALMCVGALYVCILYMHAGKLKLAERREMATSPVVFRPTNHPKDVRFEYAFAGSPYDMFEREY